MSGFSLQEWAGPYVFGLTVPALAFLRRTAIHDVTWCCDPNQKVFR